MKQQHHQLQKNNKNFVRKNLKKMIFALSILMFIISCSKSDDTPAKSIFEYNLNVESIARGTDVTNKSYINLYDGLVYNRADAKANQEKIDFIYNHKSNACPPCRLMENVKTTKDGHPYISDFTTITESKIKAMEITMTDAEFDGIKTNTDIDGFFSTKNITFSVGSVFLTDNATDIPKGNVFAFRDKNGKSGFFKLGSYTKNLPVGDKATISLTVKISK
jgi:hypothetical protein